MNQLNKIISDIFKLDASQIKDELSPDDISKWDSLSQLALISAIESNYRITFEIEEIFNMMTIGDIRSALKKRLGKKSKI